MRHISCVVSGHAWLTFEDEDKIVQRCARCSIIVTIIKEKDNTSV